jgi:hypothetical protein
MKNLIGFQLNKPLSIKLFAAFCLLFVAFGNNAIAQPTWHGTGGSCSVTVTATTPTNNCNKNCAADGVTACDHCKTYSLYNGSGCYINNFCIKATGANIPCFSICGMPGQGPACDPNCNYTTNPKCFRLTCPPGTGTGLPPGQTATFSICWSSGNSSESFQMYWECDNSPCASCCGCCHDPAGSDTNYWTDTF